MQAYSDPKRETTLRQYHAPLRFTLDGFHNRTTRHWASALASPITNAKHHARENGAAGMWRADGSLILFFREGKRIRQHTFPFASPVACVESIRKEGTR